MRAEIGRGGRAGAGRGSGAGVEIGEEVGTREEAGSEVEVEAGEGLEAVAREAGAGERNDWRPGQNCRGKSKMPPWAATASFTFGMCAAGAGNQN